MGKYIHPYNTIISPTKVRRLDTDGRFDQPMVRFGIVPYRTDSEPTKAPNPNREKKKREREREREREEERKGGRGRRGWGRRKVFSWPSWLSDGAVYAYDVACVKLERRPCFMIFLKKIKT